MPRIPRLNSPTPTIAAPDLGASPRLSQNTNTFAAINQAGQALQDFSLNLLQKRTQAETTDFVNTNENEFNLAKNAKINELQAKYTGDPKGFTNEITKWSSDWNKEMSKNAPNNTAKQLWDNRFKDQLTNTTLQADAWENKKAAEWKMGNIVNSIEQHANQLTLNPRPDELANKMVLVEKNITDNIGIHFNQTDAQETLKKAHNKLFSAHIDGLERKDMFGEALNIIDGTDKNIKGMHKYLDQDAFQATRQRLEAKLENQREVGKALINRTANDTILGAFDGSSSDENFSQAFNLAKNLPEEKRVYVESDLISAKQLRDKLNLIKSLPPSKASGVSGIELNPNDSFNRASIIKMNAQFEKSKQQIIEAKNKSPGDALVYGNELLETKAVQAKDPSNLASFMDDVSDLKKAQGINSSSTLPKEVATNYANMFSSDNAKASNDLASLTRDSVGPEKFSVVINDARKLGGLSNERAVVLSTIQDYHTREASLNLIAKKDDIDKNFKANGFSDKDLEDFKTNSSLVQFRKAVEGSSANMSNSWINQGVSSMIQLEAKQQMNSGKSSSEAIDFAINKYVDSNYDFATAGKSTLIVPKNTSITPSEIEDFVDTHTNSNNLSKFNVKPSEVFLNTKKNQGYSDEQIQEMYYKYIEDNGEWVTGSDQSSATLVIRNSAGAPAAIRSSSGSPVTVKYSEMPEIMKSNSKEVMKKYQPKGL